MVTYSPFYPGGWDDSPNTATPIVAEALNNIESGIGAVEAEIPGCTFATSGNSGDAAANTATIAALENLGTKVIYFPGGTVWTTGLVKQAATIWQGSGRAATI